MKPAREAGPNREGADREQLRLGRKRARQALKRQAILQAAAGSLCADGLEAFTVASVAARAGLSKPAVYYYFPSREALLSALLVDRLREETEALILAVEATDTGVAALSALVAAYVAHYADDLDTFRLLQIWALSAGPSKALLEREIYPLSWRLMGTLEAMLKRDRREGRLHRGASPRRLANLSLMLAHGIVSMTAAMDALDGELRFSIDGLVREAQATLQRAARPTGATR